MNLNKLFLIGFMGCGKTTIANALQQQLSNYTFVDTDILIEQINGATIPQLFATKGETFFRQEEFKLIHNLTQNVSSAIIATGGGLPLYNNLMDVINAQGTTIYIKLSNNALANRLLNQAQQRPLIANIDADILPTYIKTLLNEREPTYNKAHITVNGNDTIGKVTEAIITQLKKLA
jgi:shikimate kinase